MEQHRILFDSLEWQNGIHGARFKVFRSETKQLRLLEFTSEFVEPDWCEKGHIGFVVHGELEIDFCGHTCNVSGRLWDLHSKRSGKCT